MTDSFESMLRERFAGQADQPPGPDLVDVRSRANRQSARMRFRRPRGRVLIVALAAAIAIGGGASALAYHYLGPSPGFTAGFSAFDRLPPAVPASASPEGLDHMAAYIGLTTAEAAQRWRLVQSGVTLGPGRSEGEGKVYALLSDDRTAACLLLLGQGGTCMNALAAEQRPPGVLSQILPGYPGQTRAIVALVADNINAVTLQVGDQTRTLPIVNNSIYANLTDVQPCDTLALNISYAGGSTQSVPLHNGRSYACQTARPPQPATPTPQIDRGPQPHWPVEIEGRSVLARQLLLELSDLPTGFEIQSERPTDAYEANLGGPRAGTGDQLAWGRFTGYSINFAKKSGPHNYLAGVVTSVSVYHDSHGAELAMNGTRDCKQSGLYPTSLGSLPGTEGFVCELRLPKTYLLVWRQGAIVASLRTFSAQPDQLTPENVVALARTQARHIAEATGA